MQDRTIAVIGAAGEMASIGVERLTACARGCRFALYDRDREGLERLAAKLPPGRAEVAGLDLFDDLSLRRAVSDAALVVLGAGPYLRTAPPVLRACIEANVDYLDFDDDIESTQDALSLDAEARAAGVACLVGCGASPGLTNVLAVDAASQLDEVEALDVCWVTGDEGARGYGPAVLEHALHIAAGECRTWRDGRPVVVEAGVANDVFPMGGGVGPYRLYETPHPEAVTLPRRFPGIRSVRVMGGMHPQPANGLQQGIARAVERGRLTREEAVAWLGAVLRDESGSLAGWRHALAGMLGQVRRGESSLGALGRFLWMGTRKRHVPYRGGLLVRAVGRRDGAPATATVRTAASGPDTFAGSSMGAFTGTCLAAFATLALECRGEHRGVLAPEEWVAPEDFYAAMERLGAPREEIVERIPGGAPGAERTPPAATAAV